MRLTQRHRFHENLSLNARPPEFFFLQCRNLLPGQQPAIPNCLAEHFLLLPDTFGVWP